MLRKLQEELAFKKTYFDNNDAIDVDDKAQLCKKCKNFKYKDTTVKVDFE